jgi:hypothetical protein
MKKTLLILTAALGLTISAHANLGETKAETVERYGRIDDSQGNWIRFNRQSWVINEWINPDSGLVEIIDFIKNSVIEKQETDKILSQNLLPEYLDTSAWIKLPEERSENAMSGSHISKIWYAGRALLKVALLISR